MIAILETRLDREITEKGEQYSTGCVIIEKTLDDHMVPVNDKIDLLLKTR